MQHSEEFRHTVHSGLAAAEAALRHSVQLVSPSLSVVWLAMVWKGSQQCLHSKPQLRDSFTVHCIAMKINFPSSFYSCEKKKERKKKRDLVEGKTHRALSWRSSLKEALRWKSCLSSQLLSNTSGGTLGKISTNCIAERTAAEMFLCTFMVVVKTSGR